MALSIFRNGIFAVVVLVFTASLCSHSGYGDKIPGQMVTQALTCFDNEFIYNGCEAAYRLNPSGNINVPLEATNIFCNGPCLIETQHVLNCLDRAFENFLFYNKATAQNMRDALRVGCSYSTQRGNFNPGWFMQGEISKAHNISFQKWIALYCVLLLVGCFSILHYYN